MLSQDVKDKLMRANRMASKELASVKENRYAGLEYIEEHLKHYIAHKLFLDETELHDSISEMIRENVARSLNVEKEKLKKADQPSKCNGITVVVSKRVLLFLAIQEELQIQLPPEKTPQIETVRELAELVRELMNSEKTG